MFDIIFLNSPISIAGLFNTPHSIYELFMKRLFIIFSTYFTFCEPILTFPWFIVSDCTFLVEIHIKIQLVFEIIYFFPVVDE